MSTDDPRSAPPIATVHLVMPDSVGTWFRHFTRVHPADRIAVLGEQRELSASDIVAELGADSTVRAVFHSSHDTLLRDRALADVLEAAGVSVLCQSAAAAALAVDKVSMKEFFDDNDLATLPWSRSGQTPDWAHGTPAVAKSRCGTQSIGMELVHDPGSRTPGPDEYWEQYTDGVEYSVVVYRDESGWATFPPIWKGPTSSELVPPWRRTRVSPYLAADDPLDAELRESAVRIAELVDCEGCMEVEYLVDEAGRAWILEINPRVAGTMRLAALAAGVPIFSLCDLDAARGHLPAVRYAAEEPFQGAPFSDPEAGVFATSRLTVAADTLELALARLQQLNERVPAPQAAYVGV